MTDQLTEQKQQRDYWMKDNSIFVHDGWKYGIAKDGRTVCVGPVSGVILTPQDTKKVVQKVKDEGLQGETKEQVVFAQPKTVSPQPLGEKKVTGRPMLDLPAEKIQSLYSQGLSVKKIMEQLKAEEVKVSRRTVYNVIAGQKVLV